MKKIPLLFLSLIFSTIFASNNFDYELIRTKEAPGFFMTKIFASKDIEPLDIREVFVKNFAENEEKSYQELFPFLQQQRQAKIIDKDDFDFENIKKESEKIIILGDPMGEFLNFKYDDGEIFDQFQNFAKKNLSPVLLNNLKIKFGGNVFAVQTKQHEVTANSPAIFIGKFTNPIKTRMNISGDTKDDKLNLITALDLASEEYIEDNSAQYLPELWNQLENPKSLENPAKKMSWQEKYKFADFFPYLLGILGLFVLFFVAKYLINNQEDEDEDFNYEEEIPIFQSEIPEKEYQSYESEIKKTIDELETPFEVIWKK